MKTSLLLIVAALLLVGCQSSVLLRSETSQTYHAQQVRLLQPLTVKPETTRVFVQDGEVIHYSGHTNPYRPRCAFEIRQRMENEEQVIQPGSFSVTRVQNEMEAVVRSRPLMLAGLSFSGISNGGSPQVHAGYHFWLESDQKNLMRMTCYGVFDQIETVMPPTFEDIERALGTIAELVVE